METALQSVQFSLNVIIWVIGLGFTFFFTILVTMWMSINKRFDLVDKNMDKTLEKFDKLNEKVCRIEGSLSSQGHCLFSQDKPEKKKVE